MNHPFLRLLHLLAALTLAACGDEAADAPAADAPIADAPAAGEAGPTNPLDFATDEAALASYTLTMARVEAWQRAAQNLQRLADEDPALAETWEADADGASFSDMIAQIESEPRARRAIEEAGISPHDYVLTSLALLQAMFAQAAVDMGQPVPEGVNPANVAFVRDHQADLDAMFEGMGVER